MQSLTHALNGAVPRLQKFRIRQSEIAPPNDFGFALRSIRRNQPRAILAGSLQTTQPDVAAAPESVRELPVQLLQAHVMQFIKLQPPRESEILLMTLQKINLKP